MFFIMKCSHIDVQVSQLAVLMATGQMLFQSLVIFYDVHGCMDTGTMILF